MIIEFIVCVWLKVVSTKCQIDVSPAVLTYIGFALVVRLRRSMYADTGAVFITDLTHLTVTVHTMWLSYKIVTGFIVCVWHFDKLNFRYLLINTNM